MSEYQGLAGLLSALQPRAVPLVPSINVEAERHAAFADSVAAGVAQAEAELAPLRGQMTAAVAALEAACLVDVDKLRPVFVDIVQQLSEAVLLAELAHGTKVLMPLVEAALAAVRPGEVATLHGHPATLAALAPHLPGVALAGDESMAMDGFRVTGTDFIIDTSLRARLTEIAGETL